MTLRNINEEVGVIKAHLDQDTPDMEFILRHAESLLLMAHQLASSERSRKPAHEDLDRRTRP